MKIKFKCLEKCFTIIASSCFVISFMINMPLYFLGLLNETNIIRDIFFNIGLTIFLLLNILLGLYSLYEVKNSKKNIIVTLLGLLFSSIVAISAIINFNLELIKEIVLMLIYINSSYISGTFLARKDRYKSLFKYLDMLSIFIIPTLLVYMYFVIFNKSELIANVNLGILNYMYIANAAYAVVITNIILYTSDKKSKFIGLVPEKFTNLIRLTIISSFWLFIIIYSGTRSIIFTLLIFITIYMLCNNFKKIRVNKSNIVLLLITIIFGFQMIVPLNENSSYRINLFLTNLFGGNGLVTSTTGEDISDDIIDFVIKNDNEEFKDSEMTNIDKNEVNESLEFINDNLASRDKLFQIAIKESINNPLFGMYPMGFTHKYSMYPHNVFLEILSDFGIVTGGIFIIFIIFLFFKMLVYSMKNEYLYSLLMFIISYSIQLNSSGTLYTSTILFFSIGFSLMYISIK